MRQEPRTLIRKSFMDGTHFCKECNKKIETYDWVFACEFGYMCVKCSDKEDNENNIAY